jgi:hypothetical protein
LGGICFADQRRHLGPVGEGQGLERPPPHLDFVRAARGLQERVLHPARLGGRQLFDLAQVRKPPQRRGRRGPHLGLRVGLHEVNQRRDQVGVFNFPQAADGRDARLGHLIFEPEAQHGLKVHLEVRLGDLAQVLQDAQPALGWQLSPNAFQRGQVGVRQVRQVIQGGGRQRSAGVSQPLQDDIELGGRGHD